VHLTDRTSRSKREQTMLKRIPSNRLNPVPPIKGER
jgi:hypothetical protein